MMSAVLGMVLLGGLVMGLVGDDDDAAGEDEDIQQTAPPEEETPPTTSSDESSQQGKTFSGTEGDDWIIGTKGNDSMNASTGEDTLEAGEGDDWFFAVDYWDYDSRVGTSVQMDGGAGDDHFLVEGPATLTGGTGDDDFEIYVEHDTDAPVVLTDFEPGSDVLQLTLLPEFSAQSADLTVETRADGTGSDVFWEDELIVGLDGVQSLSASDFDVVVEINNNSEGAGRFDGSEGDDVLILQGGGSFNVTGGEGDDWIDAGNGSPELGDHYPGYASGTNVADGGAGNDTLIGSGGNIEGPYTFFERDDDFNPVFDADGNHVMEEEWDIFQYIDPDTLSGGAGDDLLITRNGGELTGGAGADTFALSHDINFVDLIPASTFSDPLVPYTPAVITDFVQGEDSLVLELLEQTAIPDNEELGGFEGEFVGGPDQAVEDVDIAVWEDGTGSDVLIAGEVVARVSGGQNLTVDDIEFISSLSQLA